MKFFAKFKCDICNRKFSKIEELMNHQEIAHYKDKPYDCRACNMNFSSMEEMRRHLQKNHSYRTD